MHTHRLGIFALKSSSIQNFTNVKTHKGIERYYKLSISYMNCEVYGLWKTLIDETLQHKGEMHPYSSISMHFMYLLEQQNQSRLDNPTTVDICLFYTTAV